MVERLRKESCTLWVTRLRRPALRPVLPKRDSALGIAMDELQLTRDESRAIDQAAVDELGLSGLLLMENAAAGVCRLIRQDFADVGRMVILCGPGNNGGDGFAIARQLAAVGIESEVILVDAGKPLTHDCDFNRNVWTAAGYKVSDGTDLSVAAEVCSFLSSSDLIVDCLLGTGIRGDVREPFASVVNAINASRAKVLAVDVPSGLDCNTGTAVGSCVRADSTVTFVGIKTGFRQKSAAEFTGQLHVAHIGLPRRWVHNWLLRYRASQNQTE